MLRNNRKRRKRRSSRSKGHIPMASASCSLPSLSSLESETCVFIMGSSSESSRNSFDPSFEDKSTSGPQVAELGIADRVTTKKEPFFMAWERAMKGSLADMTEGVAGEVLSV